jgi:hypothetical protein
MIYHDIVGTSFNIDHVVVSKKGIFSVETKTYSKPIRGECKISVTNSGLSFNGSQPDDRYFVQVNAQAEWLRNTVKESTGRDHPDSIYMLEALGSSAADGGKQGSGARGLGDADSPPDPLRNGRSRRAPSPPSEAGR